jgi:hypothetical protein
MKTFRSITVVAFVAVLAFAATAFASQRLAPQAAVDTSARIQAVQASLVSDGYTLVDVKEHPYVYIVPPTAPFVWGHLVYTYSRPGHIRVLGPEKVEVTVELHYTSSGVAVPKISIHELLAE